MRHSDRKVGWFIGGFINCQFGRFVVFSFGVGNHFGCIGHVSVVGKCSKSNFRHVRKPHEHRFSVPARRGFLRIEGLLTEMRLEAYLCPQRHAGSSGPVLKPNRESLLAGGDRGLSGEECSQCNG